MASVEDFVNLVNVSLLFCFYVSLGKCEKFTTTIITVDDGQWTNRLEKKESRRLNDQWRGVGVRVGVIVLWYKKTLIEWVFLTELVLLKNVSTKRVSLLYHIPFETYVAVYYQYLI